MRKIPEHLDFNFCLGSHLERVSIGRHDLQFAFESGATISLDSEACVLRDSVVVSEWNDEGGWSSLEFRLLLNARVESARVVDGIALEFQFIGGIVLQLHPNFGRAESVEIRTADPEAPTILL